MNKKIKKILTIFFFLFFTINSVHASLLWKINHGIEAFRKNDLKFAQNYFIDYINSNPNDEDGYYWLARTYSALDKKDDANFNYKKAHEISIKKKNIEKIDFNFNSVDNFEDYFDMATSYFEVGDLKEADSYADMMLKINPKSSSAYFVKAKIAQVSGQKEKAIENINKAIIFNNKLIKTNLAKSLDVKQFPEMSSEMYQMMAQEQYFSEDINGAIRYARKYVELNPDDIDMKNFLINLYIQNDELLLAQTLISDILSINNNLQTILYQAKIYKLKNDDRQIESLKKAYEINPNNAETLLELGNYYLNKKDYINSKKYFEILTNINDEMYEGYFGYIYSLIETNDLDNATNLIRKFIGLNKSTSEADFLLSQICKKNGNLNEAQEYISSAIEKSKNPIYYLKRAEINNLLKNYKQSNSDLNILSQSKNINEMQDEINDLYIKNYLKLNDVENAYRHIEQKISLDKKQIIYKYNLYILYKLQGNNTQASEKLSELRKIKPLSVQEYVDLSEVYFEEENILNAIKILDKGIKKYPNSLDLYSQKIKIYALLGKTKEFKDTIIKCSIAIKD